MNQLNDYFALLLLTMLIFGCSQAEHIDNVVSIEGLFSKGFEVYELKTKSGEKYHVFDPLHLIKAIN